MLDNWHTFVLTTHQRYLLKQFVPADGPNELMHRELCGYGRDDPEVPAFQALTVILHVEEGSNR